MKATDGVTAAAVGLTFSPRSVDMLLLVTSLPLLALCVTESSRRSRRVGDAEASGLILIIAAAAAAAAASLLRPLPSPSHSSAAPPPFTPS